MEGKFNNQSEEYLKAKSAVEQYGKMFIEQDDVNAVGVGVRKVGGKETGEVCFKVFVKKKLPEKLLSSSRIFPKTISKPGNKNVFVDVEEMDKPFTPHLETGVFTKTLKVEQKDVHTLSAVRPVFTVRPKPGQSSANIQAEVGTICISARQKNINEKKLKFFISCNHVFASFNFAPLGTPIIKPAFAEGGIFPFNFIGNLFSFIPLKYGPGFVNFADVAIGYTNLLDGGLNFVEGIGEVTNVGSLDELINFPIVKKIGSTTGITYGNVLAVHSIVKIDYWWLGKIGQNTLFKNQIITTLMGAYGDSGSLLLDYKNRAIGMLFAGAGTHTFFNPLKNILESFDLEI